MSVKLYLSSKTSHEICQKFYTAEFSGKKYYTLTGWQKFCEGTKGLCRKVWTWTKILSTDTRQFVTILRFVVIYALFGRLGAKRCFFLENNIVPRARSELLHGISSRRELSCFCLAATRIVVCRHERQDTFDVP